MKIIQILKLICHYFRRIKKPICKCRYSSCIVVLFAVLLCSCQTRPRITIYTGPSTNDLQIFNGEYQEVLDSCQKRLRLVEKGSVEEADIYNVMGGIYATYLLDQENALFYINKAIETHQKKGDEIGLAEDYTEMSKIYIYIGGDVEIGFDYLKKAEQIYYKYSLEDSFDFAVVLINKGHLYIGVSQYEEALDSLIKAQKIYEKRQESNISLYLLTGQVYLKMLEYECSEEQYLKALQICQNENDQYNVARVKFQLGWLYRSMEKYDRAIEYYNQSINIVQSFNVFLSNLANTYNNMAYCYDQLLDAEKALGYSIKSCQMIEKEEPITSETIEDQILFKHNLSVYWLIWYQKTSNEGFESWYQEIVIEGKDWRESDMEKKRMSEN